MFKVKINKKKDIDWIPGLEGLVKYGDKFIYPNDKESPIYTIDRNTRSPENVMITWDNHSCTTGYTISTAAANFKGGSWKIYEDV